ncbi:LysR substrate-binding domain-containing protein [Lishizhenia sp.]|uniref:LysR substrate-binding domain-containing protein n=1 Tax=Lishizhenia sp. TaxID=2497594 RepID=UPI00299D3E9E|nr:LysR substrate-binding domain-containing protein [Lishizhenia sp.]MDX1445767.1 LysR substrate-binding domain-containing protein [Lishizhenia sp.]
MDIQQIRYFLILAKELHFWRTSEKVYITQSSLSRRIKALEHELGVELFERNKRNVKLTEAGRFLKDKWEVLIDEIDRTHLHAKKIDEGATGYINICYPGSISFSFLPAVLGRISNSLPQLKMDLMEPTDQNHGNLLLNYTIDLAFSREAVRNPAVQYKQLYKENICIVVPEKHWLTAENFTHLAQLKDENFIMSGLHYTTFYSSLLRQLFNDAEFDPHVSIESDFGSMILGLVSKNLGVSILPKSFQMSNMPGIRFIDMKQEIDLFVNYRKDDKSPILKNILYIVDFLSEGFTVGQ